MSRETRPLSARAFTLLFLTKGAGLLALAYLVIRVAVPWLVSQHSDPALCLAAALSFGIAAALLWFGWGLAASVMEKFKK